MRLKLFKKRGINRGNPRRLETLKEQFYCAVVYAALYNYAGHRENTLFIHAFPFLDAPLPRVIKLLLYTHFRREGETAFETEKIETLRFDDCDQYFNLIFFHIRIFITKKKNK